MNNRQRFYSLIEQAIFLGYKEWSDVPDEMADEIAEARLMAATPFEARETVTNASSRLEVAIAAKSGDWFRFSLIVRSNLKGEYKDMQVLFDEISDVDKTVEE